MMKMNRFLVQTLALIGMTSINLVSAQDTLKKTQQTNLHFQTNYIYQYKPSFRSPYEGKNSLKGAEEKQNSITATLYFGARLWKGAELYLNPEVAGGSGLSGAVGMAGSSNGETYRVDQPIPTIYSARYFLKQTFALDHDKEWMDDAANQLSGFLPKKRLSFYIGKLSLGDLFDKNEYANSARTQFMNWALLNNGAWDYAANTRGYTYSLATELVINKTNYRLAFATLPKEANGEKLNLKFRDSFAIAVNAEIARAFIIDGRKGNLRLLAYRNNANMGNYSEASKMIVPDIASTRKLGHTKTGFGVNMDQELNSSTGVFARLGWNDGKNETWAFTEIDRTFSAGVSFKGERWKRKEDNAGIAFVMNRISGEHREYLSKGGVGFIIGDGALNYGTESITELYYNLKPSSIPLWFTGDYQFVVHPAYNKDRGPVHIISVRLHTEF